MLKPSSIEDQVIDFYQELFRQVFNTPWIIL